MTHEPPVAWPPRRDPAAPVARTSIPGARGLATPHREGLVARLPTRIAPRPVPPQTAPAAYQEPAPGVHVREGEAEGLVYMEIVLGDVQPDAPLPLIVVIHGRGDRPRVPGGPFEGLSHPVRVILPRGPLTVGAGFGWLPVVVRDGQTEVLSAALSEVGDRLARFVARVREERMTVGPTILSGFSQGGMLSVTIAVRHPGLAGAVFPLAGWLPPPLWPAGAPPPGAPPIRAMHARDDERIPFDPTRESYEHLRTLGWDLVLSEYDGVGHTMSPEMDATFHAWLEHALDAIARGDAPLVAPAPSAAAPEEASGLAVEESATEPEAEAPTRRARRDRQRRPRQRPSRPRSPRRP